MTFRLPQVSSANIRQTPNNNPLNIIDQVETNNLWKILYTDVVNIYGDEVKYIQVVNNNLIDFFGEYKAQILSKSFSMRIINNTLNDSADDSKTTTFMTNLGLVANQSPVVQIPKLTFTNIGIIPRIGDCIYSQRNNTLYRVQFVDDCPPDRYQGQDLSYELKLTIYTHNSNVSVSPSVKTAVTNIDFLETLNAEIKTLNNDKVDTAISTSYIVDNTESNGRI